METYLKFHRTNLCDQNEMHVQVSNAKFSQEAHFGLDAISLLFARRKVLVNWWYLT